MVMTRNLRKLSLVIHVGTSVGLLGAIASFLVLALLGLYGMNEDITKAAYLSMDKLARVVIIPCALLSLLIGIVQALGTRWGLIKHYWVVTKLALTASATTILLMKSRLISHAANLAQAEPLPLIELRSAGIELAVHAAAGLLVLVIPLVLSIYKPFGLTPYGFRMQQINTSARRMSTNAVPVPHTNISRDAVVTFSLDRMTLLGIAILVLAVHAVVIHVTGSGFSLH
jgi:hypothetical protein